MAKTHILCNPTPIHVKFPYEKGVKIQIPADGQADITIDQMNDFLPGRPGSEEVRNQLEHYGLFLMDTDRSYDAQALEALRASRTAKKSQFDGFIDRLRRGSPGPIDPELLEDTIQRANYGPVRDLIEKLERRIKQLEKVVGDDPTHGSMKETLDPERTCFVTQPPRQFPSKTALDMFLDDNPGLKAEHDSYWEQVKSAKKES